MSEKARLHEAAHNGHESHEKHEHAPKVEVDHARLEKERKELLEASRGAAEKHAAPSRLLAVEKDKPSAHHDIASHHAIKRESYKSLLKHTRQRLPVVTRQFSKLIHQKNVEAISNVAGQTVARPSGLLGGGLGALAGSVTLLYYSKHYGFRYNYAFFLVTFLAGFLVGLIIELIVKLVSRRS